MGFRTPVTKSSLPGPRRPPLLYRRVQTRQPIQHDPSPSSPAPSITPFPTALTSVYSRSKRSPKETTGSRSRKQHFGPGGEGGPPGAVTTTEAGSSRDSRGDSVGLAPGLGTRTLKAVPSSPHTRAGHVDVTRAILRRWSGEDPRVGGTAGLGPSERKPRLTSPAERAGAGGPGRQAGGGADPWVPGARGPRGNQRTRTQQTAAKS